MALRYELAIPISSMLDTFEYIRYAEVGLSVHLQRVGYQVAALHEMQRYPRSFNFSSLCKPRLSYKDESAPTRTAIFYKFGGSPFYRGLCTLPANDNSEWALYLRNVRLGMPVVKALTLELLSTTNLTWPETTCSDNWERIKQAPVQLPATKLNLLGFVFG